MSNCDKCKKTIDGLPYRCSKCGETFCSEHRLPENHNCRGLRKFEENQNRWQNAIKQEFEGKSKKKSPKTKKNKETKPRKRNFIKKVKNNVVYWLNERSHRKYIYKRLESYVPGIILPLIVSIFFVFIILKESVRLNSVDLWIIKLGGCLLLVALFFTIKYSIKTLKELQNWFKRQKKWFKLLVLILFLILLWQAFTNWDSVSIKINERVEKIDFSKLSPLDLSGISLNVSEPSSGSPSSEEKEISLKRDPGIIESEIFRLVNEERSRYGAKQLTSKTHLNSFARSWSDKMMSDNFFEHSNLGFSFPSTAGENIGEVPIHYSVIGCGATYTNKAIAECFVSGWIESPGHHENMIEKSFYLTGIGVSCNSFECRATQVFAG
ncbi:MAG: AN1-type zinc finger domain-containing protein [Sphaerochaetaceae bacterium]|nr:AN1-type zinc finger domain-containing protein [Sphaerochaetaceae bacterium]